ncbi:Phospho-N-acetylmuramoyl-pentapeptide-transferase [Anaerohalosphaera lusitana]|uniref:Phospho-N-acetylmuramoyl-pentapeptide-transferase n=1 Tax=Anaerohalosphaera lusitana TaxID=1936003 RepID=A0A1U9NJE0_9BACT|nr:phospho-N-acetylmuramoyl-pentapeptide-transferase [Anaerohalosphaera lusitana]AQT67690.1 Phospho-N-acetylmuramoyl-pentapeptide-transferase [Anaerohalosphaera lusitana]
MIYHFLHTFREFFTGTLGFYAYEEVMFRAILAAITSATIALITGPKIIRWLMKKKIGDHPEFNHTDLNDLMKERANTPTMGGLIILLAMMVSTFLWAKLDNPFIHKAIFIVIWFGAIGAVDDWLKLTSKIKNRSRDGLKAWEKLVFQFGGAVLIAHFLYADFANVPDARMLWLPFYKHGIPLAGWAFAIIAVLYISATSNAVNLTDGMDGLAPGCIGIVSATLIILCYVSSESMSPHGESQTWASYLLLPHIPQAGELCIFYASIMGAILGFLWYNSHPAQVFMGDIGSLPLGAAMGYGAVVARHEILLLLIGGVFVMEMLSVIMQVGYYKYSGGKRIFRCAPIHHHFHLKGWSEPQVVSRFWLLAIFFATIALATLKLR